MIPVAVLVVAKAPVPGQAKTRLAASVGDTAAADIAAAALLDTLDAVAAAPVAARVVALTGELGRRELRATRSGSAWPISRWCRSAAPTSPSGWRTRTSTPPRPSGGLPVLQIGMDTPQVTDELIGDCARELLAADAVLGLARDGGWWVLGVTEGAMADCLRAIPMSRSDTGAVTLAALENTGINVSLVPTLADVDTIGDVDEVRRVCAPGSRFVRATRDVSHAR